MTARHLLSVAALVTVICCVHPPLLTAGERLLLAWDAFAPAIATPRYPSLSEVQRAARGGELAAGQAVLLAVAQPAAELAQIAEWADRHALFCIQGQPLTGLPPGVWQCTVGPDGRLWPTSSLSLPSLSLSSAPRSFAPNAAPATEACPASGCP